jgi:hypothetical protein
MSDQRNPEPTDFDRLDAALENMVWDVRHCGLGITLEKTVEVMNAFWRDRNRPGKRKKLD